MGSGLPAFGKRRWAVILAVGLLAVLTMPVASAEGVANDSTLEAITREGINAVYDLRFEEAEKDFAHLVDLSPHQPAGYFFEAMVTWWRIAIDMDNTSLDARFLQQLDGVVDMCDSILELNPNDLTAIFFKGGAIGFKGRLEFHRDDYLAAANAGRKALPLVQTASELDPANSDILLGTGMYNYYADVIPAEYPWLKPLMLFVPPGDRAKGLEQIAVASEKGKYASVEATYFLLQIYYYYEKDYGKALALAQKLFRRFPNNVLFHRYLGRAQYSAGDWDGVHATFAEIQRRARVGQRGYTLNAEREADYYLGLGLMNQRKLDDALRDLYRCDEISRSLDTREASGFMAMANLRIGQIYDMQGKREEAMQQYRKVLRMKEYQNSHSLAEQFMNAPATN